MSLAAEILIQPSRRLAAAVLVMVLSSNLTIGAWWIAIWHARSPGSGQISVAMASALVASVWIASCVLTWRWWRAQGPQRLVIEGNGEAVWLDQPELRRANGYRSVHHSHGVSMATTDAAVAGDLSQGARRLRPVPGSLAWPGIISLQFEADAARQHLTRGSGASQPAAMLVLADSVNPAEHRALALWMYWLQRKGVAPQGRAAPGSLRF